MGACFSKSQHHPILCATLNFSGININPFEYYDGTEEIKRISTIMSSIMVKEEHNFSPSELAIIDKKYKKSDMSVRLGYGMLVDGKLPTKKEYLQMWIDEYNKTKSESIKGDTEKIIGDMALFEYYCYITLVKHVFREEFD